MILHVVVVVALLVCAVQAVRAPRLLLSAVWLAGTSALVALEMYLLGAPEVAVIELSVGAGLVTVLFVFAINIAGEEVIVSQPFVPKSLAWFLVIAVVLLFVWMNADIIQKQVDIREVLQLEFARALWEDRLLDVILQTVLIFAGVLGVLGLLAETQSSSVGRAAVTDSTLPENSGMAADIFDGDDQELAQFTAPVPESYEASETSLDTLASGKEAKR